MAGLIGVPSGSKAFSRQDSTSNDGMASINLGKVKGIIYVQSTALNGARTKCFMVKNTSVEVVGSALDPVFENYVTATITDENLIVTAKNTSGTGFVNVTVWYFG